MILRCFCWSIFMCLTLLTAKAQVQISEHGYQNVLISFSPNVPSENGKELVQSIQGVLEDASNVLRTAIGIRIASATFLLPPSWSTEGWEGVTVHPPSAEQAEGRTDISVDAAENSPFGKQPVALQHAGCGVAGHQIILPLGFLSSSEEYPKGKLLAREWLKYRYGVFDENGFPGDPLYPDYYKIPGGSDIRITECTNSEVKYIFKKPETDEVCDMESEANFGNCRTHIESQDNGTTVTSSLMYFHKDLKDMEHVCGKDDHPHHNTSRNKQNALCKGQSIWDVVKQSDDFETTQLESDDPASETIQFSYIQESRPRFVVLVENTDKLHELQSAVRFALRRFYYDLPDHSKLAIYKFIGEATESLRYTDLPAEGRPDPGAIADFGVPASSICTSCGLEAAAQILLEKSEVESGSILLITASPLDKPPTLSEKLKEAGICLHLLRFTDESNPLDQTYDPLAGSFHCFTQEPLQMSLDVVDVFKTMSRFLKNLVPQVNDNFEIKTVASGNISAVDHPLTVPRDATAQLYTLWLGRALGKESLECRAGDAVVELEPGTTGADIASFTFAPSEDNDVTCRLSSTKQDPALTQVQMTTWKGHYFDFDTWIHDVPAENEQLPIIIYAKLYFGGYPVKDANVTTVVSLGETQETVKMLDNGRGDPDVTQYDGIYSGYFTNFLEAGNYQITVKVNDNEGRARILKENPSSSSPTCCGSIVTSGDEGVPAFTMEKQIAYEAKNKTPDDGYPPSRILDLQVQVSNDSKEVTLSWTAPGGGKATEYDIKLFQNRKGAESDFETTGTVLNVSNIIPKDTGEVEELRILLQDQEGGETYYLTMRSSNAFNKKSDISNVAEFVLPRSDGGTTGGETSPTPEGITDDDEKARRALVRRRTIEIVVGVLAGIVVLCILVYLGVYFFVQRPKRKEERARARKKAENGGGHNRTVSNPSGQIGLNSIPADVIVKHHNEVEKAKSLHRDPPIFKEENLDSYKSSPELPENTGRNNKAALYTMVQKAPEGAPASSASQQDPSKSPKRMTVV